MIWLLVTPALLLVALMISRALRARRRTKGASVVFVLALPSKWAAELTARTLENQGIRASVVGTGNRWTCRVPMVGAPDRRSVEATCARLDQIARARGGGCRAHRLEAGGRAEIFEH